MSNYKRIDYQERVWIETLLTQGFTCTSIADILGRRTSSITRELDRIPGRYSAEAAERAAVGCRVTQRKTRKLEANPLLFQAVHRLLKKRHSPEQISRYLKEEHPDDLSMQISHESIYSFIYMMPRGDLRKQLINSLRQKKRKRNKRGMSIERRGKIPDMVSIDERPDYILKRAVPGHWEGDLIMGKRHQSAIGSIVERKTRAVILVKLKAKDAESVRKAFEKEFKSIPKQLKKSLTYDQGHEMAEHKLFSKNTRMKVYFCHPGSPWERGSNENMNMLIRDFFPKGTDFNLVSRKQLKRVQHLLNERPRKTLNWKTPYDVFEQEILKKCD
jgi:IS30 family transposase